MNGLDSVVQKPQRVLALDFDGVIWDSAGECFETGWRAYKDLFGTDLSGEKNRQNFLAGRPLARTGHDFFLLLRLIEEQPERDLQSFPFEEFLQLRIELEEEASRFNEQFYTLRSHYRDHDFVAWASWQGVYPEMIALLQRWEDSFRGVAIATTKDTASAGALLASTGREYAVFGKEFSLDKLLQIEAIAESHQVSCSDILFVDDLLENLEQVAPTGARTALACWGYNTEESRGQARELGYPVVDIAGLEQLLEEFLGGVPA